MDRERWERVDRIFEAALERPVADRPAFLAHECAGDEELHTQVQSLIAAHSREDGFLEPPRRTHFMRRVADGDESAPSDDILGNYRVIRRLGRGGVGEVYLAEDTRLGRPVAIKLLARHGAGDQDNIRRFRREALAASALNHPNIVTIHEVAEWRGRDFIAAEFVDGMTLRESMRTAETPISACLEIAVQVANALNAAHHAGIIHRDIKPENIMVRPDGLVKVLDFGIAKYTDSRGVAASDTEPETAAGLVIGTAAYMSPEQARGQTVDARTDIWSLGAVLYEMVARRLPFPGATASDCIAGIIGREPEPLRQMRGGTPAKLERIVVRALEKNRESRYATAAALAEDLRTVCADSGESRFWRRFAARKGTPGWRSALLVGTAGIFLTGVWYMRPGFHGSNQSGAVVTHGTIDSLAVLPFANVGGASDTEYLSDGITDSLINDLSEIVQLRVMSRNAVFRYKGRNADAREVGKALGVRAVLTGRVTQRDDDLSVAVELVDARDNSHIWGEYYKRKLAKLLDIQEDIAREITERLRLRLSEDELGRLARRQTNSADAYQFYLKGRFYWYKRAFPSWQPGSAPDFGKSRDYFQRAIEADPGYAPAYSFLGHYYAMAAGNGMMPPGDGWPKAEAAFKKAMELDPTLPDTLAGLAVIQWVDRRDWAGAERMLRAIPLHSPTHPEALMARLLAAEGRFQDAIAQVRRAIELDPISIRFSAALGTVYYYARRYDESIRQYRQALELDPNDVFVHQALGDAYEQSGLQQDAIGEWRTAMTLAGDKTLAATVDRAYRRGGFIAGVRAQASTRLERFEKLTRAGEFVPAIEYARAHLRLEHKEQALGWLEKACDEHNIFALFIDTDPFYDELRPDPRFQQLVKRIQVPK